MQPVDVYRVQVEECASGRIEDAYWVSLIFSSPDTHDDVLHIECGIFHDPFPGFQGLFIERRGQDEGDYDLAQSVEVYPDHIVITLSESGTAVLHLPRTLRFDLPSGLEGIEGVLRTFRLMSETPNGSVISFPQGE